MKTSREICKQWHTRRGEKCGSPKELYGCFLKKRTSVALETLPPDYNLPGVRLFVKLLKVKVHRFEEMVSTSHSLKSTVRENFLR